MEATGDSSSIPCATAATSTITTTANVSTPTAATTTTTTIGTTTATKVASTILASPSPSGSGSLAASSAAASCSSSNIITATSGNTGHIVAGSNVTAATAASTATAATMPTVLTMGSATSFANIVSAAGIAAAAASPPSLPMPSAHPLMLDDGNSLSLLGVATSEGQRSLSAAPSASSSPIQSPPGKIFGRNANGTMIATTRPSNEAEVQLYRVLQRASLLSYYDTLLEMGGDDVQQLYEAGEEEFLEIMALVGMASKPLHVRRLQKALHEWANNPTLFQGPFNPCASTASSLGETTPTKSRSTTTSVASASAIAFYKQDQSPSLSLMRGGNSRYTAYTPSPAVFNPTPLLSSATQAITSAPSSSSSSSASFLSQLCSTPAITVPVIQPHAALMLPNAATQLSLSNTGSNAASNTAAVGMPTAVSTAKVVPPPPSTSVTNITTHQVSSSSQPPQLTPALTEAQIARITQGAEKIASQLPQREPRAQAMKKRATRELEQVIAMNKDDPRRMEEIRKYSAIYGRFDCKRRPEKPLTLHEVCVNEAAAQLCRLVPALLTRRDELFPLARQIVKDVGFGHSASIARYGNLLPQIQQTQAAAAAAAASAMTPLTTQRTSVVVDCESSDSSTMSANGAKRKRLAFSETPITGEGGMAGAPDLSRESTEDSRYNLFAMYQKFAKPPFDLTDIAKFSFGKSDYDDDHDNDSRFSFNNSASPPIPQNGGEHETRPNNCTGGAGSHWPLVQEVHSTALHAAVGGHRTRSIARRMESVSVGVGIGIGGKAVNCDSDSPPAQPTHGGVHVISAAAAGHIIAVANPALVLSPTLNEALSLKREADSPET